ncbi:MAG: FaeA/PapI family transcriptional regulator [Chloroflexota bacterium]
MDRPLEDMTEQVYDFIADYIAEHGFPPSTREMAAAVYISRGAVARHLDRLEIAGRIARTPGRARGIRLC